MKSSNNAPIDLSNASPSQNCLLTFESHRKYPLPCYIAKKFLSESDRKANELVAMLAEPTITAQEVIVDYRYFGDEDRGSAKLIIALYDAKPNETKFEPFEIINAFDGYKFPGNGYIATFDTVISEGNPWKDEWRVKAIDELIKQFVMGRLVDCNKVYLLGVGNGVEGAFYVAEKLAHRFAAVVVSIEGDEVAISTAFRNLRLIILTDTGSSKIARRVATKIAAERAYFKRDPHELPYKTEIVIDREIQNLTIEGIPTLDNWRNPISRRVSWEPPRASADCDFYWIGVPANAAKENAAIYAEIVSKSEVRISAKNLEKLIVRLNDYFVDLSARLTINLNGKSVFDETPKRSMETLDKTAKLFGDPYYFFAFERTFDVF